jgi:hypothetical protein
MSAAENGDEAVATITLRWARGSAWFLAGCFVFYTATSGFAAVALLMTWRIIEGAVAAWIALLVGPVAWRAGNSLRRPPPTIRFLQSGGIEVRHPMLVEPLRLPAQDIHSAWVGPFEQPPPTKHDKWIGRRAFPRRVMDISEPSKGANDYADSVVIAFNRSMKLQPRLAISHWVWIVHRAFGPFISGDWVNGIVARVDVSDAKASIQSLVGWLIREGHAMPTDLRRWLA